MSDTYSFTLNLLLGCAFFWPTNIGIFFNIFRILKIIPNTLKMLQKTHEMSQNVVLNAIIPIRSVC